MLLNVKLVKLNVVAYFEMWWLIVSAPDYFGSDARVRIRHLSLWKTLRTDRVTVRAGKSRERKGNLSLRQKKVKRVYEDLQGDLGSRLAIWLVRFP